MQSLIEQTVSPKLPPFPKPTRTLEILAICCVLSLAVVVPVRGQFTQYSPPGSAASVPKNAAEKARQEAENARWHFGLLRLQPQLKIRDVGYVENVFAAPESTTQLDDSHATLGAGLAGYVKLGSNSLLSAYVAPEYSWWQDTPELRELTVNSGLAWFASFNRLEISARARSTERQQPLSAEVEAPVNVATDSIEVDFTLQLTRRLALFGLATDAEIRNSGDAELFVPDLDLQSLDRHSDRRVVGLELRGTDLAIGLGFDTTEATFVNSLGRDNSGEGLAIRLSFERDRLWIHTNYSNLELEFEDPALPVQKSTIGTALIGFRMRPKTTLSFYSTDSLAFTAISATGIIESDSRGFDVKQSFGNRLKAGIFAETGSQNYIDSDNSGRIDDIEAFGFGLRFELTEKLTLTGQVREQTWDSNFSEFDRSASSFSIGLEVGAELLPW